MTRVVPQVYHEEPAEPSKLFDIKPTGKGFRCSTALFHGVPDECFLTSWKVQGEEMLAGSLLASVLSLASAQAQNYAAVGEEMLPGASLSEERMLELVRKMMELGPGPRRQLAHLLDEVRFVPPLTLPTIPEGGHTVLNFSEPVGGVLLVGREIEA